MNRNHLAAHTLPTVLFVDMNSFFASCEQQVNFWLRGRPVGVCVYTGKHGCVIAPSVEAKRRGVKTGMRLDEAMLLCPGLVTAAFAHAYVCDELGLPSEVSASMLMRLRKLVPARHAAGAQHAAEELRTKIRELRSE